MSNIINKDLYRVYGSTGKKSLLIKLIKDPGFKFMFFLRNANKYYGKNKVLFRFYKSILTHYRFKYGIEIDPLTKIGEGFYIGHVGGIVINDRSVIGKNVNILNGVLIGYNPRGKYKGCPTIGNEVWIGANAVIVGNIKVGNNVVIAPNTLVNRDVPDGSIVYGNPMQIKNDDNATEGYVNYKIQYK